jgi:uncharacterized protein with ParB-like and HNH nuclease domain
MKITNYQSNPTGVKWSQQLEPKISSGNYKIPKFQREFVWDLEEVAKLVDSVIKGYPIGTFIVWKTKERFRAIKNLGGQELPEPQVGSEIYYILDGQQRITSLYCALNGLKITTYTKRNRPKLKDFSLLYIDLQSNSSDDVVKIKSKD